MEPIYLMQAYVQQLESSRVKLNQLEQELEQLRQQQVKALLLHQEIRSSCHLFECRGVLLVIIIIQVYIESRERYAYMFDILTTYGYLFAKFSMYTL